MQGKEDFSGFLSENVRLVREYVELRMEMVRLQGVRMVAKAYSQLMVFLIVLLMGLFVLFFLGMALAWGVAALTGSVVIGYLSSAGLFLLLLVLTVRFRRTLFQDRMVRTLLDTPDDESSGKH
jgi:MFS superfamily sulfate permease-like transporter